MTCPNPPTRAKCACSAELGIPLNCVRRDPRIGETRSPDYLAKNPNGKVPTLVDDDFVLWESPAILKYLAAKHPERKLAGADAEQAAQIDQWLFWWGCGPEAAIDALVWELLIKPKVLKQPGNDPGIIADAHTRINRFLPVLDKQLAGREFIVGPLSIADFAIGPRFDRAPEVLKFDVAPYTNIGAWMMRLRAKPYWGTA